MLTFPFCLFVIFGDNALLDTSITLHFSAVAHNVAFLHWVDYANWLILAVVCCACKHKFNIQRSMGWLADDSAGLDSFVPAMAKIAVLPAALTFTLAVRIPPADGFISIKNRL